MATIDYVRDGHKTNSTPKAKKLKTQLESFINDDLRRILAVAQEQVEGEGE